MHSFGLTLGPCEHREWTIPPAEPYLKVIELWMNLPRRDHRQGEEIVDENTIRKKTEELKAGDSTFQMTFYLKDDTLWDTWQEKLLNGDFSFNKGSNCRYLKFITSKESKIRLLAFAPCFFMSEKDSQNTTINLNFHHKWGNRKHSLSCVWKSLSYCKT